MFLWVSITALLANILYRGVFNTVDEAIAYFEHNRVNGARNGSMCAVEWCAVGWGWVEASVEHFIRFS